MKIHWKRRSLKKRVEAYAAGNRITARRIKSIDAAKNFLDLRPNSAGRAHFLNGEYEGFFAVDLEAKSNGNRLICSPKGDNLRKEKGQYIEETITELEIVEIEDYH